jgi:hypothetical protein
MRKPELLLLLLLWRGVRHHEFCCCAHSPPSLTLHRGTATAVQPSVGRQNRVHWKRPTEPKAIAVDWLGSASPSAGRFWKSLSKELSRYTTEIKGDPYDISSTWVSPRPPQTQYASNLPTCYKVFIHLSHVLQGIHPFGPNIRSYSSTCPQMLQVNHPLDPNATSYSSTRVECAKHSSTQLKCTRNSFNFWSQMLYKS